MSKAKIENLISRLHQQFGDSVLSPQQEQLMSDMQHHLHNMDEEEPQDPDFQDVVESLIEKIEGQHPKAASTAKEILNILHNIGI